MKQYITTKQLNQLSNTGRENYKKWLKHTYNAVPAIGSDGKTMLGLLLSIGQMIDLLQSHTNLNTSELENKFKASRLMRVNTFAISKNKDHGVFIAYEDDLCDDLWKACKEVLEKRS